MINFHCLYGSISERGSGRNHTQSNAPYFDFLPLPIVAKIQRECFVQKRQNDTSWMSRCFGFFRFVLLVVRWDPEQRLCLGWVNHRVVIMSFQYTTEEEIIVLSSPRFLGTDQFQCLPFHPRLGCESDWGSHPVFCPPSFSPVLFIFALFECHVSQ